MVSRRNRVISNIPIDESEVTRGLWQRLDRLFELQESKVHALQVLYDYYRQHPELGTPPLPPIPAG